MDSSLSPFSPPLTLSSHLTYTPTHTRTPKRRERKKKQTRILEKKEKDGKKTAPDRLSTDP